MGTEENRARLNRAAQQLVIWAILMVAVWWLLTNFVEPGPAQVLLLGMGWLGLSWGLMRNMAKALTSAPAPKSNGEPVEVEIDLRELEGSRPPEP